MPTTDRRPRRRHALALGAALVFTVTLLGPASSAAAPAAEDQAWAATGPLAPAAPADNRIYVSQVAGQEQARAFVRVRETTAAKLQGAEILLVEGDGGLSPETADLQACALVAPVVGSGKVVGPPDADCTAAVRLARAGTGVWSVPLTSLADAITRSSGGWFAITPVATATTTSVFTVAFNTAATELVTVPSSVTGDALPPPKSTFSGPAPGFAQTAPSPLIVNRDAEIPPSRRVAPETGPPAPTTSTPPISAPATAVLGATDPPAPLVLLAVAAIAAIALWIRQGWLPPVLAPSASVPTGTVASVGAAAVGLAFVSMLSETSVYKLGFVAIVFIAAIGLHVLVNWSGELSLAHASFVGLPAFMVAQLADHTGWTPIVFLPIGIVVGALLGLLVAIPARRARGLQVALVTLALGIAITQFLFVRSWVIGPPSGLHIPVPSLFGIRFETSRSLLPVLAVIVLLAVLAARAILSSTIGRALSQIRTAPDAAATAGVPVAAYRGAAYALAGAFAGLAGGTYVLWVQRVGPQAFPLNLGFNYLVIATLAGKGGLMGVALAALILEGGRLFSIIPDSIGLYVGPIALIYNVTRYQRGINGAVRDVGRQLRARKERAMEERTEPRAIGTATTAVRLPVVIAGVLVVVGFAAIGLAWYHAGNTDQTWIQNQEMLSGGFGGGAMVLLGAALLLRDALLQGPSLVRRPPPLAADD